MIGSLLLAAALLTPGRHAVGFRTLYAVDETRQWVVDAKSGSLGRPIRLSIWYPAAEAKKHLRFRDYVDLEARDAVFRQLAERHRKLLGRVVPAPTELQRLMNEPVAASASPPPARGKFPLVVYEPGLNESWQHANFVLAEHLASHGYVFVEVSQLPPTNLRRRLGTNASDVQTLVRDLEFARATAAALPFVDGQRTAFAGHSMGGVAALLAAMRTPSADAVVGLDASYGVKQFSALASGSPDFAPRHFGTPLLDLRRRNDEFDPAAIDALRHADRVVVQFDRMAHADFTSFPIVATLVKTDIEGRRAEDVAEDYQAVVRLVKAFLDERLGGGAGATRRVLESLRPEQGAATVTGAVAPPLRYEEQWGRMAKTDGFDAALAELRKEQRANPGEEVVSEARLTSVGYGFIEDGDAATAVSVFRLVVEAFPTSANAYDSLADGYLAANDAAGARRAYEEVLRVLPLDDRASPEQKASLKKTAETKLRELPH